MQFNSEFPQVPMAEPEVDDDNLDLGPARFIAVTLAAGMGGLFLYWGVRGLAAYLAGDRSPIADPAASLIGVMTGPWMLFVAYRLVRKVAHDRSLLTEAELLFLSLFAIIGGAWLATITFRAILMVGLGVLGLGAWKARRRQRKAKSTSTAA
jgi:hypothetical protein